MKQLSLFLLIVLSACTNENSAIQDEPYTPPNQQLHDEISALDKKLFDAYNQCDTLTFGQFFENELEFYHDLGGLMTSKAQLMSAQKNNICGKVQRELVAGSIEVYPMGQNGAIQTGLHRFHNNQESEPTHINVAKFLHIWMKEDGAWKVKRIVSYDH